MLTAANPRASAAVARVPAMTLTLRVTATGRPRQPVDLGIVPPGMVFTRKIMLRNRQRFSVAFRTLRTDCGCIAGVPAKNRVAPGHDVTVHLRLTTPQTSGRRVVDGALQGKSVAGKPVTQLYAFTYRVRQVATLHRRHAGARRSYFVRLGNVAAGRAPKSIKLVLRRGSYPQPWDRVQCAVRKNGPAVSVLRAGPGRWNAAVRFPRLWELGSRTWMLRFHFFNGRVELPYQLDEPLSVDVVGRVCLTPRSLLAGPLFEGEAMQRRVRLRRELGGHVAHDRIASARIVGHGGVSVVVARGAKSVILKFPARNSGGRFNGRLKVVATVDGKPVHLTMDYEEVRIAKKALGPFPASDMLRSGPAR